MIYFDYAATSIKRKEILKDIFDNMENFDGNPDSLHVLGRSGKKSFGKFKNGNCKNL
ncbi:conserved domain protein [Anaerococcus hydrogenalis ACS-025-V-Sch4]|uniref:Conserved domain protein n=1 Tax=Anaerococcus hydrogenalis ACS-025-V-Sch4 TaxID=879306 RepID=F0H068_9FIRM|nr:hypothetical protein [Anaerococcus hydrogenalis]EGC84062.1 conserved domain protein [Anaerococcus hydrogenalis ACS-025-V-Sch4]